MPFFTGVFPIVQMLTSVRESPRANLHTVVVTPTELFLGREDPWKGSFFLKKYAQPFQRGAIHEACPLSVSIPWILWKHWWTFISKQDPMMSFERSAYAQSTYPIPLRPGIGARAQKSNKMTTKHDLCQVPPPFGPVIGIRILGADWQPIARGNVRVRGNRVLYY